MNRIAKERIIYDNYDLDEIYPDDELKAMAVELEWVSEDEIDDITDDELWKWRWEESNANWEIAFDELKRFFDGKTVGFFGDVGLWHGVYKAGQIGNFEDLFFDAIKDCDYIKFYDENGHMYLTCSHHDGTNHFEIKIVNDNGVDYLDRWEYSWSDKRSEEQVYDQIYKRYSIIPRFMEKIYGCRCREYEPQSKDAFKRQLANQAWSRYSA